MDEARKATMIPMARVREVVARFGDHDEVPLGIFMLYGITERPLTDADIKRGQAIYAELLADPFAPSVVS